MKQCNINSKRLGNLKSFIQRLDTVLVQRLNSEETKALKKPIRVSRVAKPDPLASKHRQEAGCFLLQIKKKDRKRGKGSKNVQSSLSKKRRQRFRFVSCKYYTDLSRSLLVRNSDTASLPTKTYKKYLTSSLH